MAHPLREVEDKNPNSSTSVAQNQETNPNSSSSSSQGTVQSHQNQLKNKSFSILSSPSLIGLAIAVPFVALILSISEKPLIPDKLWTETELDSTVFDVTKRRDHYGSGGGYHHFAGRDASRAFVSGNFTGDGLTDSVKGLSNVEVKSIVDWRDFYLRNYKCVGKLIGRYYNGNGEPTKLLKGVEARAARGAQLLEKQKAEEAKLPSCNSQWSQQEGGKVWCESGYPRLVQKPGEIALTGRMSQRCACFKEEELEKPGLEVYKGCDRLSKVCVV
ncbi:hypothetical protein AMTRI_Chr01g134720 [Amborella trichopoda]